MMYQQLGATTVTPGQPSSQSSTSLGGGTTSATTARSLSTGLMTSTEPVQMFATPLHYPTTANTHHHQMQQQQPVVGAAAAAAAAHHHHHQHHVGGGAHHHHHNHHQTPPHHLNQMHSLGGGSGGGMDSFMSIGPTTSAAANTTAATSDIDREKEKQARENHCEIERRRRVKMAAYFNELCAMVPTCINLQRKPDKLTILRMASTHMRNLRQAAANSQLGMSGNTSGSSDNSGYKPSFLTDQELKHLILEAADGFLFVAQCDSANIIYVSDALQPVLAYSPSEWMQRSLYEFVHPDDLEKVKEQLSTSDSPVNGSSHSSGRILDLKTGTVKKESHQNSVRSHLGTRRSFICRIRVGVHPKTAAVNAQSMYAQQQTNPYYPAGSMIDPSWSSSSSSSVGGGSVSSSVNRLNRPRCTLEAATDPSKPQYAVVHVTGYTKIWPPQSQALIEQQQHHSMYMDENNQQQQLTNFHLIAIARLQMTSTPTDLIQQSNYEFVTRHDHTGLITFVDQRVTSLLGYQPNEMLKKNLWDFCIAQDQAMLKEQLKLVYENKQQATNAAQMTLHMTHASNPSTIVKFKTTAYAFCNPCNDSFEFIVCTHTSQQVPQPQQQQQQQQQHSTRSAAGGEAATTTTAATTTYNPSTTMGGLMVDQYGSNVAANAASSTSAAASSYLHSMGQYAAYQMNMHAMHHPNTTASSTTASSAPQDTTSNGSPTANSSSYVGNYLMMPNMNSATNDSISKGQLQQQQSSSNAQMSSSSSSSNLTLLQSNSSSTSSSLNQWQSPNNFLQ